MSTGSPEDRAFGWDDPIQDDEQGQFTLIEPGVYPFEIVDCKHGKHIPKENGKLPPCPKAELIVRVYYSAEGLHSDIRDNLYLHSRCEGMLCTFFRAIGQRKHGEPLRPRWQEVIGSKGRCQVYVDEYWSPTAQEKRKSNKIKAYLDPPQQADPSAGAAVPVVPPTGDEEGF